MRGNMVMKGYYKNPEATAEAFKGGWFRSGDIAFQHPDGYLKITDRAKDIIISGGENVSSVEVEGALMHHPAVVALCRGRQARCEMGRGALRLCRAETRRHSHRGRVDRALPHAPCGLQNPETCGVHRASQDLDRKNPEV